MAYEIPGILITLPQGADLSATTNQFRFVKLNTSGQVILCAAATDKPLGILQDTAAASTTGLPVVVMLYGVSKVQGGADLTKADLVGTDSNGQAAAYVFGTDTTKYIVGQVIIDNSAANGIATIAFNCLGVGRGA